MPECGHVSPSDVSHEPPTSSCSPQEEPPREHLMAGPVPWGPDKLIYRGSQALGGQVAGARPAVLSEAGASSNAGSWFLCGQRGGQGAFGHDPASGLRPDYCSRWTVAGAPLGRDPGGACWAWLVVVPAPSTWPEAPTPTRPQSPSRVPGRLLLPATGWASDQPDLETVCQDHSGFLVSLPPGASAQGAPRGRKVPHAVR